MTGNTDPRVEAAWDVHDRSGPNMTAILTAADVADRAAGIVRVREDDQTVERVMDALVMTRMGDYNIEIWEFRNAARAVLAALRGES